MKTTSLPSRVTEAPSPEAFTFVELLVVVAVLALVFLTLLPALARTQPDSRAFQCLNNHRQLARAWRMYADDNNDRLAGVIGSFTVVSNDPNAPWIQGWLDYTTSNNNTNEFLLADPRYASIANYAGRNARLFQCPADGCLSSVQRARGWKQRARSISANICLGGVGADIGPTDSSLALVTKWTALVSLKPSEAWLYADEHPDSLNDPVLWPPRIGNWIDMPANYHDGGAGVAFADGHSEIHRWQGSALSPRISYTTFSGLAAPANDPDIAWLRYHTPRKPGMN